MARRSRSESCEKLRQPTTLLQIPETALLQIPETALLRISETAFLRKLDQFNVMLRL
jgi:hypothetical protein